MIEIKLEPFQGDGGSFTSEKLPSRA
jgi:hypothetical protein